MGYWDTVQQTIKRVKSLEDVPALYEALVPHPIARVAVPTGLGFATTAGLWNALTPEEQHVNPFAAGIIGSALGSAAALHSHLTKSQSAKKKQEVYGPPAPNEVYKMLQPSEFYGPPTLEDAYRALTVSNVYGPPSPAELYRSLAPSHYYGPPSPYALYTTPGLTQHWR